MFALLTFAFGCGGSALRDLAPPPPVSAPRPPDAISVEAVRRVGAALEAEEAGDLPEAEEEFAWALRVAPQDADLRLARARLRLRHGLPGASDDAEAAIGLIPDRPEGYALRAGLRLRGGDFAGAALDAGRAADLGDPLASDLAVRAWLGAGDRDRAILELEGWISTEGGDRRTAAVARAQIGASEAACRLGALWRVAATERWGLRDDPRWEEAAADLSRRAGLALPGVPPVPGPGIGPCDAMAEHFQELPADAEILEFEAAFAAIPGRAGVAAALARAYHRDGRHAEALALAGAAGIR